MASIAPTCHPGQGARIVDIFGRQLRYLRLGITDRCNLRCEYCHPNTACPALSPEVLSWEDLEWLVGVAVESLGVEALRVTGGEPTVRPGLVEWVSRLRGRLPGLGDLSLTTNGILLEQLAAPLARAGVDRVSISLDSLHPRRFSKITRGGALDRVLRGIDAALPLFATVKINTVALRDGNMDELADFVRFSHEKHVEVRFIEPMPLGDGKDYWRSVYISTVEIRERLAGAGFRLRPAGASPGFGPATSYAVEGTNARVGFISQMSCAKCHTCNKLRVTSDGTLRPCLLSPVEIPLRDIIRGRDEPALRDAFVGAFASRPREYHFEEAVSAPLGRPMQCIGG